MRKGQDAKTTPGGAVPEPEFSRPYAVDKLGAQPAAVEVSAKPAERAALVQRFDLDRLDRLEAELTLRRAGSGLIRVEGRLRAEGAQVCVVSLEPVPFTLDLPVGLTFAPAGQIQDSGEVLVEAEGEDPPEPIEDGAIDLGEAMAQIFAVALDPYPRASEATLTRSEFGPESEAGDTAREGDKGPSPFAALEELKRGRGDDR